MKGAMAVTIAITNKKGGVGKTDLCVNLASCLAANGKKVLVLDLDPQGNATDYLTATEPEISTSELLLHDEINIQDIIIPTGIENLSLVPADLRLNTAQLQLSGDIGMQFKLKRKLDRLGTEDYDYIFIDTPPSLGLLTINALTASDQVLVPIQVHYFAMSGVVKLMNTVREIQEQINPKLKIGGFVMTMFDRRIGLSSEVEWEVRKEFKDKVFRTMIPINVKLAESPSHHKPIILYSKSSRGARAYQELAKEFLEQEQ